MRLLAWASEQKLCEPNKEMPTTDPLCLDVMKSFGAPQGCVRQLALLRRAKLMLRTYLLFAF